jgi:hypothetical protein
MVAPSELLCALSSLVAACCASVSGLLICNMRANMVRGQAGKRLRRRWASRIHGSLLSATVMCSALCIYIVKLTKSRLRAIWEMEGKAA